MTTYLHSNEAELLIKDAANELRIGVEILAVAVDPTISPFEGTNRYLLVFCGGSVAALSESLGARGLTAKTVADEGGAELKEQNTIRVAILPRKSTSLV